MKIALITFILSFIFIFEAKSQADTLVINLKNNQVEKIPVSQIQKIQFENITSVNQQSKTEIDLSLTGNYPNPVQDKTDIEFEIASFGNVVIIIYDNNGNQIQKLECVNCQPGKNSIRWNCTDMQNNRVKTGVYYYEVQFGNEVQARKMIVIR
jgi:hypothetical protein